MLSWNRLVGRMKRHLDPPRAPLTPEQQALYERYLRMAALAKRVLPMLPLVAPDRTTTTVRWRQVDDFGGSTP